MEATLISSLLPLRLPLTASHKISGDVHRRKRVTIVVSSSEKDEVYRYSGGRVVDENMVVLRKRIHEMKMVERNYEPPSHWMEWEKRYYTTYDATVCDALSILQTFLMNSRPSLAFGTLLLILISVPVSAAVFAFCFIDFAHCLLATTPHI